MNLESINQLWESDGALTADTKVGPTTESRYRGVLLGAAVGNLLGIPVEGMDKRFLRASYPSGIRDIDSDFKVTPPSVHQMVLTLEKRELIERVPGQPRTIQVLLSLEEIPVLGSRPAVSRQRPTRACRPGASPPAACPHHGGPTTAA